MPLVLESEDLERRLLAACPYFAAEALEWSEPLTFRTDRDRFLILVILEGEGTLAGEPYGPGTAYLIPAHAEALEEVQAAGVKHADETTWRQKGQAGYMWAAATLTDG